MYNVTNSYRTHTENSDLDTLSLANIVGYTIPTKIIKDNVFTLTVSNPLDKFREIKYTLTLTVIQYHTIENGYCCTTSL